MKDEHRRGWVRRTKTIEALVSSKVNHAGPSFQHQHLLPAFFSDIEWISLHVCGTWEAFSRLLVPRFPFFSDLATTSSASPLYESCSTWKGVTSPQLHTRLEHLELHNRVIQILARPQNIWRSYKAPSKIQI
jgi:hypothetical protein